MLAIMLAIVSEFLNCFVDAGFVLVIPLHHRHLELDSVGVAILVAWLWLGGGAISQIKILIEEYADN